MAYSDLLSKIIKESSLSLKEVSARLSDRGISLTPSYISQIQTGKLPPPSDEISKIISEVCGAEPLELMLEGYLEKAPEIIKAYFTIVSETNKELLELIDEEKISGIHNIEEKKKITNVFTNLSMTLDYLKRMKNDENIPLFTNVSKKIINSILQLDFNSERIVEHDSLEPLIPKDSLIKFEPYKNNEEPKNGDIIIFRKKLEIQSKIRQYYKHKDIIMLVTHNKHDKVIVINSLDEIILQGKVVSYTVNI